MGCWLSAQSPKTVIKLSDVHGISALEHFATTQTADGTILPHPDSAEAKKHYITGFSVINDFDKDTVFYLRNTDNAYTNVILKGTNGKILSTILTGYYVPINKRFGHDENGFIPLAVRTGQTVFITVDVVGYIGQKANVYCGLYTPEAYYKFYKTGYPEENTQDYLVVFFVGAIFMLMVFFCFMYLKSKQALYGRYAFYLSFQFVYGLMRLGPTTLIGYYFFHVPVLKITLLEPIVMAAIGGYIWFVMALLNLKPNHPRLFKLLKTMAVVLWIYSFVYWLVFYIDPEMKLRVPAFYVVRFLLISINIFVLWVVAAKVKSSVKTYYIIGNILFIAFSFLAGFSAAGTIFTSGYLSMLKGANWYSMGILAECIFFAFGLGIRIKELQREKNEASNRLIEQMQLNETLMQNINQQLEQKLAEGTAKILEKEKELQTATLQETKSLYEKQLSDSRMQALRSRMNPHFLFNSLNSIKYFILKNENDTAAFYLNRFSKLLRQILEYSNEETITLQQELDTLKLYLEIESLRFDKSFHYDIRVEEDIIATQINIPPLILQPFVENAIWHGLANSETDDKFCLVYVHKVNDQVMISIQDNGVGRLAAAVIKDNKLNKLNDESFGMKITQERINIFNAWSDNKLKVSVEDHENEYHEACGTTIKIIVQN